MISVLLQDSKYFVIGDKKYAFSATDPIFTLEKPAPKKEHLVQRDGSCTACQKSFKSAKSVAYCEFCGSPVCKDCLVKNRPLPGSSEV